MEGKPSDDGEDTLKDPMPRDPSDEMLGGDMLLGDLIDGSVESKEARPADSWLTP